MTPFEAKYTEETLELIAEMEQLMLLEIIIQKISVYIRAILYNIMLKA